MSQGDTSGNKQGGSKDGGSKQPTGDGAGGPRPAPPNGPSKTGKPSGSDRGNNPPRK